MRRGGGAGAAEHGIMKRIGPPCGGFPVGFRGGSEGFEHLRRDGRGRFHRVAPGRPHRRGLGAECACWTAWRAGRLAAAPWSCPAASRSSNRHPRRGRLGGSSRARSSSCTTPPRRRCPARSRTRPLRRRQHRRHDQPARSRAGGRHRRRFVFASSCAVYGDTPGAAKHEASLTDPLSPYASSKLVRRVSSAGTSSGCTASKRSRCATSTSTGRARTRTAPTPPSSPSSSSAVARGEAPVLYGDGEQSRDFIHVDDVVEANERAVAATRGVGGRVVNVGSGQSASLKQVLADSGADQGPTAIEAERLPAAPRRHPAVARRHRRRGGSAAIHALREPARRFGTDFAMV